MKNIARIFADDMKRLASNTVTGIIVLGLILLPSIFSWYNVIACWDVFGNTGNLTVAVANSDEGYQSDLIPLEVNVGEQVVSELRANDQLDWEFTDEEEAIEGTKAGRYFAAVVIPPSFSKDMMTFYSTDVEHADIVYYTNEKKNAIAPIVTDQGADQVSYQVNEVFAETLSEVGLGVASALADHVDETGANGRVADLAAHISDMGGQMQRASAAVSTYAAMLASTQGLIDSSADLLAQAHDAAGTVGTSAGESRQAVSTITDAIAAASDALSDAIKQSSAGFDGMAQAVDEAFSSADGLSADTASALRERADAASAHVERYQELAAQLESLKSQVGSAFAPIIDSLIAQVNASISLQQQLCDGLEKAAGSIESGNADAQSQHDEINRLIAEAAASVEDLSANFDEDIKPGLEQLEGEVSSMVSSLAASAEKLQSAGDDLEGAADSVSGELGKARAKLDETAASLSSSADKLADTATALADALASNDMQKIRDILGSDPASLAAALAAPVQLDRHAVFPAENFGSQMAPLYTTLGLWIGSLLMLVAIKTTVPDATRRKLVNPKPHQLFLGRFGIFAFLSLLQTSCAALGNMFFLDVQANEPLLYLICFWMAGLVFTFLIYTLVVSFANLGKAFAVLLLILQVSGGGGAYPLQVLPDFFQALSPYLPATHVINAMRAAMMGVYQNDFWMEIGMLALFLVPALLLGLVLRKPLEKFLNWYIEKVEDSKLVA